MKSKLKKIIIPFVIMIIVHYGLTPDLLVNLGIDFPHVGLLFVFGLLLGPYGSLGAVSANIILDLLDGYTPIEILPSAIISFGVSYLAYKLWYSGIKTDKITILFKNNRLSETFTLADKPFIFLCHIIGEGITELGRNFHVITRKVSLALS